MTHGSIAGATERTLIRAVACGDASAVDELYHLHSEQVLRFIFRRTGEHLEDAEELTMDTFESAIRLAGGYDGRSSVRTWLCGIAKVRIVDFYRRRTRGKRVPEGSTVSLHSLRTGIASLDDTLRSVEASHVVDAMLEELNEDERESILLRYVEQLSVREISILMNRSEKGIEGLLSRGKLKARSTMGKWLTGGSDEGA